jgi:hypothetical protein
MALTTLPGGFVVRSLRFPNDFEPLTASDQEVVSHGLPRRPKDPTLMADWEDLVKSLARSTFIEPEFSPTDPQHDPRPRLSAILSEQWSGGLYSFPQTRLGERSSTLSRVDGQFQTVARAVEHLSNTTARPGLASMDGFQRHIASGSYLHSQSENDLPVGGVVARARDWDHELCRLRWRFNKLHYFNYRCHRRERPLL